MMNKMERLDFLESLDLDDICLNESRLGPLKFERALPQLEKMRSVLTELEYLNYRENLSTEEIREINSLSANFDTYIKQIQEFTIDQNPQQKRDQIENEINQFFQNIFFQKIRTPLVFLRQEANPTKTTEKELRRILSQAKSYNEELKNEIQKIKTKKEEVSEGKKTIGTTLLSIDFNEQFSTHERKAERFWFVGLILFYIGLVIFIIINFYLIYLPEDVNISIEQGVFNFLILVMLYYGLNFCSRNFNIQKNLAILNRHRRNVAETFQRFLESGIDDEITKNKLLEEASKAMFENQATGHLSKDQMQISTPVQEMVTKIVTDKSAHS